MAGTIAKVSTALFKSSPTIIFMLTYILGGSFPIIFFQTNRPGMPENMVYSRHSVARTLMARSP